MARSDFEKTYIWYNLVTIIYSEIGGVYIDERFRMHAY